MHKIGFLFDLDGVLIDSEREYTRIWEKIDTKFPTGKKNFAASIKGQTLNKILEENYDETSREEVTKELHRLEKLMTYNYCLGAEKLLNFLQNNNIKTAVVTSSDESKMSHLYEDLPNFKEKVDIIVDASKVTKSKPDPEGYLLAARELELDIKNCTVLEDSVQGVMAGKSSGAYVIGITGTKTREELIPHSHLIVDSLEEIDLTSIIDILTLR